MGQLFVWKEDVCLALASSNLINCDNSMHQISGTAEMETELVESIPQPHLIRVEGVDFWKV